MTDPRIEGYLRAGTDPLSVVLPAVSDWPLGGYEGSPPGWLGTGYRANTNVCTTYEDRHRERIRFPTSTERVER
jgi:hypothetical protein